MGDIVCEKCKPCTKNCHVVQFFLTVSGCNFFLLLGQVILEKMEFACYCWRGKKFTVIGCELFFKKKFYFAMCTLATSVRHPIAS